MKKGLFKNGSIQLIDTIGTAKEQRPMAWNWEQCWGQEDKSANSLIE